MSLNLPGFRLQLQNPSVAKRLYRDNDRMYFPFNQPHLGLGTKDFDGPMVIEDIFYLGEYKKC